MSTNVKETKSKQPTKKVKVSPETRRLFLRRSYGTLVFLLLTTSFTLTSFTWHSLSPLSILIPSPNPNLKLNIHDFNTYKSQLPLILVDFSFYMVLYTQRFIYPTYELLFSVFSLFNSVVLATLIGMLGDGVGYQAFVTVTSASLTLWVLSYRYDSNFELIPLLLLLISSILTNSLINHFFPFPSTLYRLFAILSSCILSLRLIMKIDEAADDLTPAPSPTPSSPSSPSPSPPPSSSLSQESIQWGLGLYGNCLFDTSIALIVARPFIEEVKGMTASDWVWKAVEYVERNL